MNTDNFFILEDGTIEAKFSDKILFRTATEFSMFITTEARKTGKTLTQTILGYMDEKDIEPDDIKKLISRPLRELIAVEMQGTGLLRVDSTATFGSGC